MRIATTIFLTDHSVPAVRLARELEERGFDGLYLPEHTHIPVSRRTPAPMGEPLPPEYGGTLDPFVGLAAAAAVTRRLRLGTGIRLRTGLARFARHRGVPSPDGCRPGWTCGTRGVRHQRGESYGVVRD